MAAHALLSASASHRWLECTPSARLEEAVPNQVSSYAEEGTIAHALGELKIRYEVLQEMSDGEYLVRLAGFKDIPVDMEEATNEYLEFVQTEYEAASKKEKAFIKIEQRIDYSHIAPDGFGTADCVIINDDTLHVIDYKHGKGVSVSAVGNPQARLYAVGAAEALRDIYDFKKVRYSIVQPRIGNFTSETISLAQLDEWAEQYAKPRAELAYIGKGEFRTGDHCRFCRVAATCRARAEEALRLAAEEFTDSPLLTIEEIAEGVLPKVESIKHWCEKIKEYALGEALRGVNVPGYKVVEGMSRRKVRDDKAEAELIAELAEHGFDINDTTRLKIKPLGELEKLVGKKQFAAIAGDLVIKPKGSPTLVPESDARPEYNSIETDFKED